MDNLAIALSGDLGSGKSSVADRLALALGARRLSTGAVQRQIAERRGVSTLELNRMAESDPGIDAEVDSVFRSLASAREALVVDSRLAWHFLPGAFKVHLVVDPEAGARRVLGRPGSAAEHYSSLDEALERIAERAASEQRRFVELYGVDIFCLRNYDLVVDTSEATPDEVADGVLEAARGHRGQHSAPVLLVAPSRVVQVRGDDPAARPTEPPGSPQAGSDAALVLGYLRPRFYALADPAGLLQARPCPTTLVPGVLLVEDGEVVEGEPTLQRRWESIRNQVAGP
ncbi:MAG: cytidylate kinase family protein [Actinomycetota bacterium]|nr:cytidylate kinase family protein [Actinomycetota bacterium]